MKKKIFFIFKALARKIKAQHLRKFSALLSINPLNAEVHYYFSQAANKLGLYNLSNAELKCAEYLGLDSSEVLALNIKNGARLTELDELDVNQYQRFVVLQTHINKLLKSGDSILDIGGGHGILSQFLPNNRYFLVEPSINGISGLKLPFSDNSFDVVVACHVLEHVEEGSRSIFINEMLRVSKKHVLIFNPFKNELLDEMERMQLIFNLTKMAWVKEHIECGLPTVEEITGYLSSLRLSFVVKGYGDIYASVASVFMAYYAEKLCRDDFVKVKRHLNQKYDQLSSSKYPVNIMIEITKSCDNH